MRVPKAVEEAVAKQLSLNTLADDVVEIDYAFALTMREGVVEAMHERDVAKRAAEIKFDKVFLDIKNNPELYKLSKPSDALAKSKANVDEEYVVAYEGYLQALKEYRQWSSIQAILEHKTAAMRQMQNGANIHYFSMQDATDATNSSTFEYSRERGE